MATIQAGLRQNCSTTTDIYCRRRSFRDRSAFCCACGAATLKSRDIYVQQANAKRSSAIQRGLSTIEPHRSWSRRSSEHNVDWPYKLGNPTAWRATDGSEKCPEENNEPSMENLQHQTDATTKLMTECNYNKAQLTRLYHFWCVKTNYPMLWTVTGIVQQIIPKTSR